MPEGSKRLGVEIREGEETLESSVVEGITGFLGNLFRGRKRWVKNVTCPRCGSLTEPTGKEFAFGVFEAIVHYCQSCEKSFNVYYRDEKFSHTVPKADVEVYDAVSGDAGGPEGAASEAEEGEALEQEPPISEQEAERVEPEGEAAPDQEAAAPEALEEEGVGGDQTITSVEEKPPQELLARSSSEAPGRAEDVIGVLRGLREDVLEITELSAEEGNIVGAFSAAFLGLMSPLTKALPVDVSILPDDMGEVEKANIMPKGELVLMYRDGRMDSLNLALPENRDLMISVVRDVMPRFRTFVARMRERVEGRVAFFSEVTEELQILAEHARRVTGAH